MSAKKKEVFPQVPFVSDEENLIPTWMNKERTKIITESIETPKDDGDCVYYWMQRDMRTQDNWALLYANYLAQELKVPLKVLYVLPPPVPSDDADGEVDDNVGELPPKVCEMQLTERYGSFLLGGLEIVEKELMDKNVPFEVLKPNSHDKVGESVLEVVKENNASVVVVDMSPLRQFRQ